MNDTNTGLIFETTSDGRAARIPVMQAPTGDLYPEGFRQNVEITRRWMDYLLAEQLRSEGVEVVSPDLLIAGSVIHDWPEPKPLGNVLTPVLPFDLNFLPISVQPWVKDVSERMSVPLDFAGVCCLVVLAGCVNRRAFVYPKAIDKDWKEALAISGAVIASSGKTKTPTWKVFTNPLLELEIEWQDEYKERVAAHEQALRCWKEADKTARRAKNQSSKETKNKKPATTASFFDPDDDEEDSADPSAGPMPETPDPCRRLMTNDATPEKFHILASENAEGLFVYRDELSGWVAELDQDNRAAEREMFLLAMTGNDAFTLDRVERGTVSAILSASLFGGFQPDLFAEVLNSLRNVSDGTLPRFGLLCYPDDIELPLVDRAVDDAAKQRYRRIVRTLATLRAESVLLNFAPDAQRVFTEWLALHTKRVNEMPEGGLKSHFAKYKGLLPKLAGLLQLVDLADKGSVAGHQLVDAEHLSNALRLLGYLESYAVRAYGCIQSPLAKAEAALARHLRKGDVQDGFSVRTIKRKHWADLSEERDIEDGLKSLEELGWIRVMPNSQNQSGRPTTRWEVNPSLRRTDQENKA